MRECPVCQHCFPDPVARCPDDTEPTLPTLPVETVIQGRYRLEKRIGHGSVSIVYQTRDLTLRTTAAVKIILPDLIGNDRTLSDRLLHEATAVAALHHPNIVEVTDSGVLNGIVPFVVMELVCGPSLQDLLSMSGALTPAQALIYISAIGSGLAAAHKLGIVHGDLKPRNILIEKDRPLVEAIKILDFGLSKIKSGNLHGPLAAPKGTGMLRSALYLAPEEWSDSEPDNRADIYSLGIILYQMLAGDMPFKGRSIPAIMKQHLMSPPPPIIRSSGRISSELEAVVWHALEKEPAKRPATVEDFVEELRSSIGGAATPPSVRMVMHDSRKEGRRPDAKTPERAGERAHGPVDEDVPGWNQEKDGQHFQELNTLVNRATPDGVSEFPQNDPNQTIVISSPRFDPDDQMRSAGHTEFGTVGLAGDQTVVIEPQLTALDETIIPGLASYQEFSKASGKPPLTAENDEQVGEGWREVGETAGTQASSQTLDPEAVQGPRSISPLLLAAGVILIILLIAAGVFYSHMSQ